MKKTFYILLFVLICISCEESQNPAQVSSYAPLIEAYLKQVPRTSEEMGQIAELKNSLIFTDVQEANLLGGEQVIVVGLNSKSSEKNSKSSIL